MSRPPKPPPRPPKPPPPLLTPQQKENFEAIEGFLHRAAMKVLEAPASKREAVYQAARQSVADTFDPEFAEQFMTWLRALVSIIESGGGARGGTA